MDAYLVEVGVLLPEDHEEFEKYSNCYDKKHGFFDEEQFYTTDKQEAVEYVKDYVDSGLDTTYGIVSKTTIPDDFDFKEDTVEGEEYKMEDVLYSAARINDVVVEGFLKEEKVKANYRITFYDGPEGNRSKNVDVCAESFDDAGKQAWQMDEAKCRMYSDMMIEKIPDGPSVIGIEFEFEMNRPPFYEKGKDYLFIRANSEAEALQYYNSHFKGERYNRRAGETVPDGCRVRKRAIKTYFAAGCVPCADATIEGKENSLDKKIEKAKVQSSAVSKEKDKAELNHLER